MFATNMAINTISTITLPLVTNFDDIIISVRSLRMNFVMIIGNSDKVMSRGNLFSFFSSSISVIHVYIMVYTVVYLKFLTKVKLKYRQCYYYNMSMAFNGSIMKVGNSL